MNRKAKNIAVGTVIAGLAGYVAGILTAPKSGGETRRMLRRRARTLNAAEVEKQLKHLHAELSKASAEAQKAIKSMKSYLKQK